MLSASCLLSVQQGEQCHHVTSNVHVVVSRVLQDKTARKVDVQVTYRKEHTYNDFVTQVRRVGPLRFSYFNLNKDGGHFLSLKEIVKLFGK